LGPPFIDAGLIEKGPLKEVFLIRRVSDCAVCATLAVGQVLSH
jgi:hypothetical protein